jgi:SAM-dependent methyltransferase
VQGSVLGVDVSAELLEVARRRSAQEGLRNVAFEEADAQLQGFPPAGFDLCISRFGVMFFADPAAAFANIGRAMRPGARLVWMVWQSRDRNEWATVIRQALEPGVAPPTEVAPAFSMGDPAITTDVLNASGFVSVEFAEVHEPVFYGPDVDAACEAVIGLQFAKDLLARADEEGDAARQRLRDLLETHLTADGVLFDSRAWIITAYRANG